MKALLLSAYAAQSHVHWQRSLLSIFPEWQWEVLSLPPRHFSWRVRGNPLYWSLTERERLEQDYDLLIATSMTDLATLRGLVPSLSHLPSLLYFHENQFDYPQQSSQSSLLEAQMVSLYSALAADRLAFNSHYNRDTFLAGVDALLRRLPDRVPAGVADLLAQKAYVLPVPIDIDSNTLVAGHWRGADGVFPDRPLRLLWNGRFEYDKGGETLWHTLEHLERLGLAYELALTGQQFRNSPAVFARIEEAYSHRLVQFGYLPLAEDYHALLCAADVVLSTAQHEFQGLAVLEAVAYGCVPVVPARQAYPEIYPAVFCYDSYPDDAALEASSAATLICQIAGDLDRGGSLAPDVSAFNISQLRLVYRQFLQEMVPSTGW